MLSVMGMYLVCIALVYNVLVPDGAFSIRSHHIVT